VTRRDRFGEVIEDVQPATNDIALMWLRAIRAQLPADRTCPACHQPLDDSLIGACPTCGATFPEGNPQ